MMSILLNYRSDIDKDKLFKTHFKCLFWDKNIIAMDIVSESNTNNHEYLLLEYFFEIMYTTDDEFNFDLLKQKFVDKNEIFKDK